MYRITRGHHVQHIHFPLPVLRDLDGDGDDENPADAPPGTAAPAASQDGAADADPSAGQQP